VSRIRILSVTSPSSSSPPPFVDLHNHLVPGVDDGSESVEESLGCLAVLFAEGVRSLVSTPHLLLPRLSSDAAVTRELDVHRRAFDHLMAATGGHRELPALGLGQEIWAPDAGTLARIVGRTDVGLDGSATLLVEFGFDLQGEHTDVVLAARDAGRRIVIAHPERYRYLEGTIPLELMRRWRELGALLQVNAGSFTGHYRSGPEALAWGMVTEGLVDLVGSDHHGIRRAGVSPLAAYQALIARGEPKLAARAMSETPGALVEKTGAESGAGEARSPAAGG
jgi:protein-tyrosine phosphatase